MLYGSETGNAHDLAEELGCLLERLHFSTLVAHLDIIEPVSVLGRCKRDLKY